MHPLITAGVILIVIGGVVWPPSVVVGLAVAAAGAFTPVRSNHTPTARQRVKDHSV